MDISSMLEVQVNEVKEADIKENVTPGSLLPRGILDSRDISNEEKNVYKHIFSNGVAAVRFGRLHCTGCDAHIGSAPAQADNMFEHPVLRTLLCVKCREFYGDGTFEQGDDATDMFCRWCANGGNLYCCSYCSNTFCSKCIKRNLGPAIRKKIEADEKWKCFVCDPSVLYSLRAMCWALLEHIQTVTRIIQADSNSNQEDTDYKMNLDESRCCSRRRKRKRRRTSNSEEEDETYTPNTDEEFLSPKRKLPRRSYTLTKASLLNGSIKSESERPSVQPVKKKPVSKPPMTIAKLIPILPKDGDIFIDRESFANREHMPSSSASADIPKVQRRGPGTQHGNTPILSAVPTAKLLKTSSSTPPPLTTQPFAMSTFQCIPPRTTPMVSIPTQQSMLQRIVITNSVRLAAPKITPNIIDIDSDSEEPAVAQPSDTSQMDTPATGSESFIKSGTRNAPAVPVALVSARSSVGNDVRPDQPLREKRSTIPRYEKEFSEIFQPYERELESTFNVLRNRFRDILENIKRDENKGLPTDNGKVMVRRFHRLIRGAVMDLAGINDRVVRGYNKWKRYQEKNKKLVKENPPQSRPIIRKERDLNIPLDMACVNESDSEEDNPEPADFNVISPSELVGISVLEDLQFYKKRKCFDRSVGTDNRTSRKSKSVQVDDVELKDYEGSIFYSVVKRCDDSSIATLSEFERLDTTAPGGIFKFRQQGYEKEFLRFLGHETQTTSLEEFENVHESSELLLVDLIEESLTNLTREHSAAIADAASKLEQCNNIQDKTVNDTEKTRTTPLEQNSTLQDDVAKTIEINNGSISETHSKKENLISDPIDSFNNTSEKMSSLRKESSLVVNSSNVQSNSNTTISNMVGRDESEDDCTIIDE